MNTFMDQKIPEDSSCKYLGIIICSDLSWAEHVDHMVQKAWRALHFVMRVVKKGNKNTKVLRTSHWYVRFSNMGQRVGTHTGNAR